MVVIVSVVLSVPSSKTIFYSLADDHVVTILAQGMEHIEE